MAVALLLLESFLGASSFLSVEGVFLLIRIRLAVRASAPRSTHPYRRKGTSPTTDFRSIWCSKRSTPRLTNGQSGPHHWRCCSWVLADRCWLKPRCANSSAPTGGRRWAPAASGAACGGASCLLSDPCLCGSVSPGPPSNEDDVMFEVHALRLPLDPRRSVALEEGRGGERELGRGGARMDVSKPASGGPLDDR